MRIVFKHLKLPNVENNLAIYRRNLQHLSQWVIQCLRASVSIHPRIQAGFSFHFFFFKLHSHHAKVVFDLKEIIPETVLQSLHLELPK